MSLKTAPTPHPAAQAQELTPDGTPKPAPPDAKKAAEAARFAAIRKRGEAKAAKRAAFKRKKQTQNESAQADSLISAGRPA